MFEEGGMGVTNYQCPECGHPEMGEECGVCAYILRLRTEEFPDHSLYGWRASSLLAAFDFQKARAEKAEAEHGACHGAWEEAEQRAEKAEGENTQIKEGAKNVIRWAEIMEENTTNDAQDSGLHEYFEGRKSAYAEFLDRLELFRLSFPGKEAPKC